MTSTEQFNSVVVVGLGYIGLPTAAALATQGMDVVGVDVNPTVVDSVNRGEVPFVEPDLAIAVSGAVATGKLSAAKEVPSADAYIVAVPTPFNDNKTADLSFVRAAAEEIAPVLEAGQLVILESTSPLGATRQLAEWLAELRPDLTLPLSPNATPQINVAHCPERVLPGRIMIEIVTNDRVVGGLTRHCAERAAALYRTFCQGDIAVSDAESAELAKLAENAFRDVNIAFANELSLICDRYGIDVWEVIEIANRHPRVDILNPGPGVGGHCIAVDPWFIVQAAPEDARLVRVAREVNDSKPGHVVRQVMAEASKLADPVIACLGIAFKADVDDLRESPSLEIVERICEELPGAPIHVVEPNVDVLPRRLTRHDNARLTPLIEALDAADLVVLLVDHSPFKSIPPANLAGKFLVDTRGLWSHA